MALYSLIFEIAEVVFAGHKADPGTSPTGTLLVVAALHPWTSDHLPHAFYPKRYDVPKAVTKTVLALN